MTLTTRTLLLGITALTPGFAWGQALPTGGAYVAGSGSISTTGGTTTIDQSSARGVINWQGFSVGAGASVRFNNGSGATLNRVTGAQSSSLLGHIGATGTVFLINPNGVVIGPGGTVVTGGSFIASTRDTPNSTFMKGGNVILSGSSAGTVTNAGKITSTSGNVVLVGASVTNKGTVSAAGGTAALLAGNQVVLSEVDGPSGIYIVADSKAKGNVTNTGRIRAAAATLASAGGNVYALAGNREGLVQATGTTRVNGQVWLSAPHGTVTVESTTLKATSADGSGGIIRANGRAVNLRGKAVLNASASKAGRKGGHILVGTDSMGGTNLARSTTLASGVTLKATGKGTGAGGTIETSAHTLAVGAATISAGPGGSWLLDPDDLTIDSNAASTINSALNSGTNVTEQTSAATSNITGTGTSSAGNGDILLNAALSWNSAARLILSSYHSITLNADITVGGAGKLTLTTNNNIGGTGTGDGTLNFGTSSVRFTSSSLTAASTTSNSPLTIDGHSYTLITSPGDLQNAVGVSGYYALARPLDMSSISNFTPLTPGGFTGTFNGLGNTISNLVINNSGADSVGLFGQVSTGGTIRNVGLIQANVTDYGEATGSLAGVNDGTISNVYATGNVTDNGDNKGISNTASSNSGNAAGGLIGVNEGTISDAYVTENVTQNSILGGNATVGGLVGLNYYGTISNVYATGNMRSTSYNGETGDLVGYNYYGTISNAYATGNVNGTGGTGTTKTGGLVGYNYYGTISNAYATGNVTGSALSEVGGLVGYNSGSISNAYATGNVTGSYGNAGGLVGYNYYGTISDVYATGNMTGNYLPGALICVNYGTLNNAYFDTSTSGTTVGIRAGNMSGGKGLTTVQWLTEGPMVSGSPYSFTDPGAWISGSPYPILAALPHIVISSTGAQTYGQSAFSVSSLTFTDQNSNNASSLVDTSNLKWYSPLLSSTSNAGTTGAMYGTGATAKGYQITYQATDTVSKAALAITALNQTGIYGQNPTLNNTDLKTSGLVNGDTVSGVSLSTTATNLSNTGAYALTASNARGSGLSNYAITYQSGTYDITPAALAITALNQTGIYGQNPTLNKADFKTSGLVNGDTVSGVSLSTAATKLSNTGAYALTASNARGSGLSNYAITYQSGTYDITPAALAITALNQTGIYGQSPTLNKADFKTSGLVNGDTVSGVSLSTTATNLSNTGAYALTASNARGSGLSNYAITYQSGTYDITPAALAITALNQTGIYGQNPTLNNTDFKTSGLVNGDTVSRISLSTAATNLSNTGAYALTASNARGSGLSNYAITYQSGTYDITPAALAITALNQTGIYGQNPTLNNTDFKTSGLVNGDTVSRISLSTAATNLSNTGAYALTASNARGSGLSNYAITYQSGTYDITPAALAITALNQTGIYGQNPTLNNTDFKTSGLVNGDTVSRISLSTAATKLSNTGAYALTASNARGSGLSNYAITYQSGTYDITPAALAITALNQTGIYGQNPTLNNTDFKTSGLVNGDTVSGVSLSTTATKLSNTGAYALTASNARGSGLSNYAITYQSGTYDITPAALAITALNQTGIYGQNPTLNNTDFKTSGLVNGDTVSGVSLSTTATKLSNTGAYALTASNARGSGLSNYAITYQSGTYDITPAALAITALNQTGIYGQNPTLNNTDFKTSGLVNGDTVSGVSLSTTATNLSNTGAYALTASNARGSGLSNYAITYQSGTYDITRITTIPIFWPVALLNGNTPPASGPANLTTTSTGQSPGLTLVNTYNPLPLPDSTANSAAPNTYQIVLPGTSYTNRLKDTF